MKKHRLVLALVIAFGSAFSAAAQRSNWDQESENFLLSDNFDDRIHINELSQEERASGVHIQCTVNVRGVNGDNDSTKKLTLFLNASQEYYMRHDCSRSQLKWKMSVRAESYIFHTLFAPNQGWQFTDVRVSRVNGEMNTHKTRIDYGGGERYLHYSELKSGTCQRIEPIACPALNTQF